MNELEQQQLVQWVLLCKIGYNVIFGLEIRQRTAELSFHFVFCLGAVLSMPHIPFNSDCEIHRTEVYKKYKLYNITDYNVICYLTLYNVIHWAHITLYADPY